MPVLEEKALVNTSFIPRQKGFRPGVPYVLELLHTILHWLGCMREAKLSLDEVRRPLEVGGKDLALIGRGTNQEVMYELAPGMNNTGPCT